MVLPAGGEPRGVFLVLYGGKSVSRQRSSRWHLSAARVVPLARGLHRAGTAYDIEVRILRYRFRGWNGPEASAAVDAAWALDEIGADRPGVPVVVVGHSMGGRAALRVASHPAVIGAVALAPWVERSDPVAPLAGCRLRILHGRRDRWTSFRASAAFAEAAGAAGADVRFVDMGPVGHFMLRRRGRWLALTSYVSLDALEAEALARGAEAAGRRTIRGRAPNGGV